MFIDERAVLEPFDIRTRFCGFILVMVHPMPLLEIITEKSHKLFPIGKQIVAITMFEPHIELPLIAIPILKSQRPKPIKLSLLKAPFIDHLSPNKVASALPLSVFEPPRILEIAFGVDPHALHFAALPVSLIGRLVLLPGDLALAVAVVQLVLALED
jgi:hypothetical protein